MCELTIDVGELMALYVGTILLLGKAAVVEAELDERERETSRELVQNARKVQLKIKAELVECGFDMESVEEMCHVCD